MFCGILLLKGGLNMANEIIKATAKRKSIRLWEVAESLEMQDSAFSRKLRKELPQEEKEKILAIIDRLAQEKQEGI